MQQRGPPSYPPHHPVSPRSALRSLQEPRSEVSHGDDCDPSGSVGPSAALGHRGTLQEQEATYTDDHQHRTSPPSFRETASPPSLRADGREVAPTSSYVSRPPPFPAQSRPWSPPQSMFAPESVFKTFNRSARQHIHLPQPPQYHRSRPVSGSGSLSVASTSASSQSLNSQPLPTPPAQELHQLVYLSGGSSSNYSSISPTLYDHTQSRPYSQHMRHEADAAGQSDPCPRRQSESPFAFSVATPRTNMASSVGTAGHYSHDQQGGAFHSNEAFSYEQFPRTGSQNRSPRILLPQLRPEIRSTRSVDDYLAPLHHDRQDPMRSDAHSTSRSWAPGFSFHRSGSGFSNDPRGSFSPASLSEGRPSSIQCPTLPPILSGSSASPADRRSMIMERLPLSHRYSHPALHSSSEESKTFSLSPVAARPSASSSPGLSSTLKRPRRSASQVEKDDQGRFLLSPSASKHRPRSYSMDRRRDKAPAQQPEQNKLSHAEVMYRLNMKVRQRIKAASLSASSSPPDTISASGLTRVQDARGDLPSNQNRASISTPVVGTGSQSIRAGKDAKQPTQLVEASGINALFAAAAVESQTSPRSEKGKRT